MLSEDGANYLPSFTLRNRSDTDITRRAAARAALDASFPLTLDTLAQRRDLLDAHKRLEEVSRRLRRTESALESIRQVLSAVGDPVEVIGADGVIHFANRASRKRHGGNVEGLPYAPALLGVEREPDDCPARIALNENRETRTSGERDGEVVTVTFTPVVLASGERAVVRHTRRSDGVPPGYAAGESPRDAGADAEPAAPREAAGVVEATVADHDALEALREAALACAGTLDTGRLLEALLAHVGEYLECPAAGYYEIDDDAEHAVLVASAGADPAALPQRLHERECRELANLAGIDAPYLRVADLRRANPLPASVQHALLSAGAAEAVVVPARTAHARYGVMVAARATAVSSSDERFLASLSQLLGPALERNRLVHALERGIDASLDVERAAWEMLGRVADAVAVVTSDGRVERANRAFYELLGIGDGALPAVSRFLFPLTRAPGADADEIARALAERAPLRAYECEVEAMDGTRIPIELDVARVESEEAARMIVTMRDRRRVEALEETLLNALNLSLSGERIAGLAHQVNNYLTPAFYHAETLAEQRSLDARTRQAVTTIQNYLHLCHESILAVLQIIRPDEPGPMDVNDLLAEVLSRHSLGDDLHHQGVSVVRDFDAFMPVTLGYRVLMQQALANVIRNAEEAMAESDGGELHVATEATPATITVCIADNGPGIPETIRNRVFELGVSGKPAGQGTGVGLHFTREIVRKHRGSIQVHSETGRGATFTIRIPVRAPDPAHASGD
jgi:signal transduction histidine kinase